MPHLCRDPGLCPFLPALPTSKACPSHRASTMAGASPGPSVAQQGRPAMGRGRRPLTCSTCTQAASLGGSLGAPQAEPLLTTPSSLLLGPCWHSPAVFPVSPETPAPPETPPHPGGSCPSQAGTGAQGKGDKIFGAPAPPAAPCTLTAEPSGSRAGGCSAAPPQPLSCLASSGCSASSCWLPSALSAVARGSALPSPQLSSLLARVGCLLSSLWLLCLLPASAGASAPPLQLLFASPGTAGDSLLFLWLLWAFRVAAGGKQRGV